MPPNTAHAAIYGILYMKTENFAHIHLHKVRIKQKKNE